MTTAKASRVRPAELVDGDLVCWSCKARLIAGYAGLIEAAGPVPFFGEMTLVCNRCSCANRSPSVASAGTAPSGEAVAPAKRLDRAAVGLEDSGSAP
jgi:hypothetical protein